jgi:hypothetical protein
MKILIAVAPERFRDEELMVPVAAFQKADIAYDIASTRRGPCSGMLGAKTTATLAFGEVDPNLYGVIVIIGGGGSQVHLWNDPVLRKLVQSFHASRKIVAAICLSPVVLAHAGILNEIGRGSARKQSGRCGWADHHGKRAGSSAGVCRCNPFSNKTGRGLMQGQGQNSIFVP